MKSLPDILLHRYWVLSLTALIPLYLAACLGAKPELELIYGDHDLTREGLKGKRVAVAAMLTAPGTSPPNEVEKFVILTDLEALLQTKVGVLSSEVFAQKVGELRRTRHWTELDPLQSLFSPSQIASAKSLGASHVLLISLRVNSTDEKISKSESTTTTSLHTDEDEMVRTYRTRAVASRRMVALFCLYDLTSGRNVWYTRVDNTGYLGESEESNSKYPEAPPFRMPPRPTEVMKEISEAWVDKLPL